MSKLGDELVQSAQQAAAYVKDTADPADYRVHTVPSWEPMSSAPLDGTMFLVKPSSAADEILPCFRRLHDADDMGGPAIANEWVLVEGCPDGGGYGVSYLNVGETEAADWQWKPMS